MTVYIILFSAVLVTSLLTRMKFIGIDQETIDGSLIYWLFVLIVITLVEGLRDSSVGADLLAYIQFFTRSGNLVFRPDFLIDFSAFEPGYTFLNYVLFSISEKPSFFVFASSLIIVFLHTFFLYKNSKDFAISILLFFGFGFFFTSMVSLRQFIAMGIVFWCYPAAYTRKYLKFVIIALIAFYFHQSSVICSIMILISVFFKNKKKLLRLVFIIAMVLLPVVDTVCMYIASFFPKYVSFYLNGSHEASGLGKLRIVYIFLEIILLTYTIVKYRDEKDEPKKRIDSMFILLILAIYLGVVSSTIPYAFRLGYYFDYFLLLFIPEMLALEHKYYKLFCIGIIVCSVIFFGYYLSVNPGKTVPYMLYIY